MRARVVITVVMLILYVGLFNIYIYDLHRIDIKQSKLFYNYLTLGAISFFVADLKAGFVNEYHKQFNLLLILSVIVNYVLIICVHSRLIQGVYPMFYTFDFTVFAITLTIFICEINYKTFRD